ncbi:MAG TPA: hypothetical protein PLQ56_27690 [Aggregatilineales bacterium]|nr:hypothetical protein [Aggregatilineales bacterium]
MGNHKAERDAYTIQLKPGVDDDLIQVLGSIPPGNRNQVLKELLRRNLALPDGRRAAPVVTEDTGRLWDELGRLSQWINAELPVYIDQRIAQVAAAGVIAGPPEVMAGHRQADEQQLRDRAKNIKSRQW